MPIEPIEMRVPTTAEEFAAFVAVDGRAFGIDYQPEDLADIPNRLPWDRVVAAVDTDTGATVGGGGAYVFDLTLPGGSTVPVAGITWICTDVTHRRRGVLRATMAALHDLSRQRGEPAQILTASEGGIYERFGYGVATRFHSVSIAPRATRLRTDRPTGGRVEICTDRATMIDVSTRLAAATATDVPGTVSLPSAWFEFAYGPIGDRIYGRRQCVLHRADDGTIDGIVTYRLRESWTTLGPDATVDSVRVLATTPAAHADLWNVVLGVDLARRIELRNLAPDDPLHWLVDDPRSIATTAVRDDLWLRPDDVARLLEARAYATDGSVSFAVEDEAWTLDAADGAATCTPLEPDDADVRLPRAVLGAALLGGVDLAAVARAGRLQARDPQALPRLDRLLRWPRHASLNQVF